MLAPGQALDIEMQSTDMKYRKPRQNAFKGVYFYVAVCQFVRLILPLTSCQSVSRSMEQLWRKGACQSCRAGWC